MTEKKLKWAGRNEAKDLVRARIWNLLVSQSAAVGDVFDKIPGFTGVEQAVARLVAWEGWQRARVVKCNPDTAHIAVRLAALEQGKLLYMPVPELARPQPYLELDPQELRKRGVPLASVASKDGALSHGRPVDFFEMQPLDLVHVGCVAASIVGGRTGKGGGFGDLELGIFREVGIVSRNTPIVTCVHDLQIVEAADVPIQPHDSIMSGVFTPTTSYLIAPSDRQPQGVDWDRVLPEQYRDIPFLAGLRDKLLKRGEKHQ
jgi:5-formyltetrahydrofolate cyclo-ligase